MGNQLSIDGSDTPTYPLQDALGSVRLSVDETGNSLGTSEWDAWGTLRSSTGSGYGFGWAGEQYDASSDLTYLRSRYYSPGTATFLSRDTVQPNAGGATGYNPYSYANGNPTTFTDPSGHLPSVADFGGGIAGVFLLLAYVFECYLSGNCLYRSEWGDSAKHELLLTVQFACSALSVASNIATAINAGPLFVGAGCPPLGQSEPTPVPPGTLSPNDPCHGHRNSDAATLGLDITAGGGHGAWVDWRNNMFGFSTFYMSRCHVNRAKESARQTNSLADFISFVAFQLAGSVTCPNLACLGSLIATYIGATLVGNSVQEFLNDVEDAENRGSHPEMGLVFFNQWSICGGCAWDRIPKTGIAQAIYTQWDFKYSAGLNPCNYPLAGSGAATGEGRALFVGLDCI